MATSVPHGVTYQQAGTLRSALIENTTETYLSVLGLRPSLGRWFTAAEDTRGAAVVAVMGHRIWTHAFGADRALRADGSESSLQEIADGGAEAVFDFVGEGRAIGSALALVKRGGAYFAVGYGGTLEVPLVDVVAKEMSLVGNLVGTYNELAELMALAEQGRVRLSTTSYPLEAVNDAILAAWDAQVAYGRKSPAATDSKITAPAGVDPAKPTFPSMRAAAAGAASTVLTYLLPDATPGRFDDLAKQAAMVDAWSGADFPSDVTAGLALGKAVGAKAVERGKNDGSTVKWDPSTQPKGEGFWVPTPPRFVSQPASHVLLCTRLPNSRLTPDASRSDAVSAPTMMRAARCWRNADTAKRHAAARASAVTATMLPV